MKAVLAYSGGLDTSCAIAWLKEDYGFDEVVAVLVDVGQEADFEPAIARGYAAGADDVILLDKKDEFAEQVVAKALLANALYEGKYPLISALSRPVIGEAIGEIALELGADAVVHGCTGKGNDQVRFELAFKATYPGVRGHRAAARQAVVARRGDRVRGRAQHPGRGQAGLAVLRRRQPVRARHRGGRARGSVGGAARGRVRAHRRARRSSRSRVEVVIGFEAGLPVSLDGEELPLAELVAALNELAGSRGIGRIDMIENRVVGIKSRELYEAPAALTLIKAHDALEDLVLTKAEQIAKRELEPKWAQLVYDGFWFTPVRAAYDAFFAETQKLVSGEVRVKLESGAAIVDRPAFRARALRRVARLVRHRRDVPARVGRRLHLAARARGAARRRAGAPAGSGGSGVTVWGARTGTPLDERVWAFLQADDAELLRYDCEASRLHAGRLAAAGLITAGELAQIEAALERIAAGPGLEPEDEDVHSAIERQLGELGRKIHAGRSRNDQVAAAFRLYVVAACDEAVAAIEELAETILGQADAEADTPMPGYTHLQRAQPVTVGHHLLAWIEMLDRDRTRFGARAGGGRGLPARLRARSRARPCRCRNRPAACATRSTASPTATSRSTTSTRAPCCSRTSRGWRRSSSCGSRASSASRGCHLRPQPGRR